MRFEQLELLHWVLMYRLLRKGLKPTRIVIYYYENISILSFIKLVSTSWSGFGHNGHIIQCNFYTRGVNYVYEKY